MASKFTIQTVFAAVDSMTKPLQTMTKSVDELGRRVDKTKGGFAGIGRGISIAGKAIASVSGVALAAAAAAGSLALKATDAADAMHDVAQATGISTKALQEYRYLGKLAGLTTDEMDKALEKLTINLGKGGGEIEDLLGQVGLSISKLKGSNPDEILESLADAFENTTDQTTKAAIVTALFGKSSIKMVNALSAGRRGLAELRAEANAAGYVLDDLSINAGDTLSDNLDRMKMAMDGLVNRVGMAFVPTMDKAVQSLTRFIIQSGPEVQDALGGLGGTLEAVFSAIEPILGQVMSLLKPLLDLVSKIFKALQPLFVKFAESIQKMIPFIAELADFVGVVLVEALDLAMPLLEPVFDILGLIFDILTPIIRTLTKVFKGIMAIWKAIPGPIKTILAVLNPFIGGAYLIAKAWGPVKGLLGGIFDKIKAPASAVWEKIEGLGGRLVEGFKEYAPKIADTLRSIPGPVGKAFDFLFDLPGKIALAFKDLPDKIWEFLKKLPDMILDLLTPIANFIGGIFDKVEGLFNRGTKNPDISTRSSDMAALAMATASGAPVPISSSSVTTQRSAVEVNFRGAPAGTTVKTTGAAAPRVTLQTGRAIP